MDEAILEAVGREEGLTTLRLYAWQPACLSLGYAQSAGEVDFERLQTLGWDLVRRPTGGRAILHTDELTYSITGAQTEPRLAGSVLESYRTLSAAILQALILLDIPALALPKNENVPTGAAPGNSQRTINPVCFEVPSNYEITVHGKKLVGSAQARRKEGVLQHGSLPLFGDLTRITRALIFPGEMARQETAQRLLQRATTVETILGHPVEWNAAAQAFVSAFKAVLNIDLVEGELTPGEARRAGELVGEKYANPAWTKRI